MIIAIALLACLAALLEIAAMAPDEPDFWTWG